MFWPTKATTFTEYVRKHMKPYLESQITPTVAHIDGGKLLLSTKSESVISNRPCDVSALQPCNHSEADTRIFLHLGHAASQGHQKTYVRTVDSDAHFSRLVSLNCRCVSVLGKKICDIPVHDVSAQLGPSRSLALPLFHAITGYDTTSQFLGCGKKTTWTSWQNTTGLTETLVALTDELSTCRIWNDLLLSCIARDVVRLWSVKPDIVYLPVVKRTLENIQPLQAVLFEHIKRALLQASFCLDTSYLSSPGNTELQ